MPATPAPLQTPTGMNSLFRRVLFSYEARRTWAAVLAVLTVIVVTLALLPGKGEHVSLGWDKIDHAAAFASLAFSALFALRGRPALHAWITAALLALGVGIEFAQMLVPGRVASVNDVVADAVGIAIGLVLSSALSRALERRSRPRRTG